MKIVFHIVLDTFLVALELARHTFWHLPLLVVSCYLSKIASGTRCVVQHLQIAPNVFPQAHTKMASTRSLVRLNKNGSNASLLPATRSPIRIP